LLQISSVISPLSCGGASLLGGMALTCPWSCVAASSSPSLDVTALPKSFAATVGGNISRIDEVPLPVPCIEGDALSIRIRKEDYVKGLTECQTTLRGRLTLVKGDKPLHNTGFGY